MGSLPAPDGVVLATDLYSTFLEHTKGLRLMPEVRSALSAQSSGFNTMDANPTSESGDGGFQNFEVKVSPPLFNIAGNGSNPGLGDRGRATSPPTHPPLLFAFYRGGGVDGRGGGGWAPRTPHYSKITLFAG